MLSELLYAMDVATDPEKEKQKYMKKVFRIVNLMNKSTDKEKALARNTSHKEEMKVVVTIGYDRKESFCYSGIINTILETLNDNDIEYTFIDLYEDGFHPSGRGNIPELI